MAAVAADATAAVAAAMTAVVVAAAVVATDYAGVKCDIHNNALTSLRLRDISGMGPSNCSNLR